MMKTIFVFLALMITAGCASQPDKIATTYVSPIQYNAYQCNQIAGEFSRVSRRTNELYGSLKKEADNDAAQMAVGMLFLWPTLFFLEGGDGPEAAEYARLKGESEALEIAAIQKNCDASIVQQFPPLPEPVEEPESNPLPNAIL